MAARIRQTNRLFSIKKRVSGYYLSSNKAGVVFLANSDKQDKFQQWRYLDNSDAVENRGKELRLTYKDESESLILDSPVGGETAADSYQKWELVPLNEIDSSKSQVEKLPVRNANRFSSTVEKEREQTNQKGKKDLL